jgi:hypothetical protein
VEDLLFEALLFEARLLETRLSETLSNQRCECAKSFASMGELVFLVWRELCSTSLVAFGNKHGVIPEPPTPVGTKGKGALPATLNNELFALEHIRCCTHKCRTTIGNALHRGDQ